MKKKKQKFKSHYLPLLIIVATLFMGVGYASVSSITLGINGNLVAEAQEGVYISEVSYVSNSEADIANSLIINCYQTMMNSKVVLSDTDGTSSITYKVTVYNNTNINYYFNKVVYDTTTNFYSNSNIAFKLSNITRGDKLRSGKSMSFNIMFYYVDETLPDTSIENYNILSSYLNFVFTPESELIDYYIDDSGIMFKNSLTTGDITSIATYSAATSDNFKIDGDNGLYINDTSSSTNMYAVFGFLEDDGYTSTFDPSNVYYSRMEYKLVTKHSSSSYLQFVLSNYFHSGNRRNGISTKSVNLSIIRDDYYLASIWGKPVKHSDRLASDGSVRWAGDYGDAIQIGSSASGMSESYVKNLAVLDLSTIFGVNNEPNKAWCDSNIKFDTVTVKWFAES